MKKMLAFFIATRYTMTCVEMTQAQAPLAQLAEHLTLNQGVQGSNPWRRTSQITLYKSSRLDRELFCI